jgi:hypothetical protein
MFSAPHDVQLVAAGAFATLDGTSLPSSFDENGASFTFLPDPVSLDALRTGALHELEGTLYLGNFENGGRPLPSRTRFSVERVVFQQILDGGAASPRLDYIVFGSRAATFAVHRISGAPSFDEVLRVDLKGQALPSDADLARGVDVALGEPDDIGARLGLATGPVPATIAADSVTIAPTAVSSCLVGPDFEDACP